MTSAVSTKDDSASALVSADKMIFAVVPKAQAEAIAQEIMQVSSPGRPLVVQVHIKPDLDDLDLPEYATEAVQGWHFALSVGTAVGLISGWITGLTGWIQGVGPMFGAITGVISGFTVGALCAVMSGYRLAAAPLRQVFKSLESHERLLTIDLGDRSGMAARDQAIWDALEQRSLRLVDTF